MNTPPPTSTAAIVSAVSGVLAWAALPFIGALVAVIAGHVARADIRRSAGTLGGDGWALLGLVLGWVQFAAALLSLAVLMLFLGGLAALATWLV